MIDSAVLRILWGVSLGLVLLMLLMLFYLIERKSLRLRHLGQVAEAVAELENPSSALGRYLITGERSRSLTASALGIRREAMEEALLNRLAISSSQSERERVYALAEDYFADEYDLLLGSRRWSERMNTLLHIEKFRIQSCKPKLLERLRSLGRGQASDDERFLLVRTLASLHQPEALEELRASSDRFSELQLMQVLRPVKGELQDRLVNEFGTLPARIAYALLDTLRLANIRTEEVLQLFERCLLSDDAEMRVRALKALANFGYMTREAADLLEPRMREGSTATWPERLMQVRLAGAARDDRFIPHLERMMADPSYEVRREAAASLSKYRDGTERMRRIAEEHPDRFAREMAAETLERRAYERNVG